MSMGMTTTSTTVTISGSVTTTPTTTLPQAYNSAVAITTQTPVLTTDCTSRAYNQNNETTALTYNVTAGKTYYVTDIWCRLTSNNGPHRGFWRLYNGATQILGAPLDLLTTTTTHTGAGNFHFKTPISFAAASALTIKITQADANGTVIFSTGLNGYEV
jgi:hypothetical protein